jgi:hypothetical protein
MRELWDVVLMGRGGDGKSGQRAEHGWHGFLERAFNENRPWPQVLREMGFAAEVAVGAVRLTLGRHTTAGQIDEAIAALKAAWGSLRRAD